MATEEPRNGTYQSLECFKPFFYNLGGSNTKGACEFGSYFLKNNKTKYQKKNQTLLETHKVIFKNLQWA